MSTVTCNFQGRLGNLLYEIANTLATGWRSGSAITFCTEHERGYYNDFAFYRDYVKHIIKDYPLVEKVEGFYVENEDVRKQPKKYLITEDTQFKGYWTSSIYFEDYRERIIQLFTRQYKAVVDDHYAAIKSQSEKPTVAVHVRRADYASEYNWALGIDYYGRAFQHIRDKLGDCRYVIFSDDPSWCKENLYFMQDKRTVELADYIEMQLMGRFDGLIMANSTFSAWGAILGKQQLVIAPDPWRDTKEGQDPYNEWIYEKHWIRL